MLTALRLFACSIPQLPVSLSKLETGGRLAETPPIEICSLCTRLGDFQSLLLHHRLPRPRIILALVGRQRSSRSTAEVLLLGRQNVFRIQIEWACLSVLRTVPSRGESPRW